MDAFFRHDRFDQAGWRDVECRVAGGEASGHLGSFALFDRNRGAGGCALIDRRRRSDDHERDAVMVGEHRQTVRADLVRGIAVRSDAIGAGNHDIDLTGSHP